MSNCLYIIKGVSAYSNTLFSFLYEKRYRAGRPTNSNKYYVNLNLPLALRVFVLRVISEIYLPKALGSLAWGDTLSKNFKRNFLNKYQMSFH